MIRTAAALVLAATAVPAAALEIAFPLKVFLDAGVEVVGEKTGSGGMKSTVHVGKHRFACEDYNLGAFPGYDKVTCRPTGALAGFDLDGFVAFLKARDCGVTRVEALDYLRPMGFDAEDLAAATNALVFQRLAAFDRTSTGAVFALTDAACAS
jgi:hypothetical protein